MAIFGYFLKHRVRRTGQKRPISGVNLNAPKIMSDATILLDKKKQKQKKKPTEKVVKNGPFRDYINCAKTTEKLIQGWEWFRKNLWYYVGGRLVPVFSKAWPSCLYQTGTFSPRDRESATPYFSPQQSCRHKHQATPERFRNCHYLLTGSTHIFTCLLGLESSFHVTRAKDK